MKNTPKKPTSSNSIPKYLFIFSLCLFAFLYGFFAFPLKWFPYAAIIKAATYFNEVFVENLNPKYYVDTEYTTAVPVYDESAAYNGLTLITSVVEDKQLSVRLIDMDGKLVHEWGIDWFELWPDPSHLSKSDPVYPESAPGTHIHGALLLENGDLLFNFTNLGLIRLDICGNVIWRLPYQTHHSIYMDENDILWVPGMIWQEEALPDYPNFEPPFYEPTILKVSLDGEILDEIFVFDLLKQNDLLGILYLSSYDMNEVNLGNDPLHFNDVETFPSTLEEGIFSAGDIMISLRNRNTILVFRENDLQVTQVITGEFIRQHDPDFIDGNTISVYNNNAYAPEGSDIQSEILILSLVDGERTVFYTGTEDNPFYTSTMGNSEWLPNGNLLIAETRNGRAIEVDGQGNIVWEYINLVGDGKAGWITDVHRLPQSIPEQTLNQLTGACEAQVSP